MTGRWVELLDDNNERIAIRVFELYCERCVRRHISSAVVGARYHNWIELFMDECLKRCPQWYRAMPQTRDRITRAT